MSISLSQYWTSPNGARQATRFIVFHHAAFTYPAGGAVLSIYNYHRSKWPAYNACGYHLICQFDADGQIRAYQVNPHEMQGAGVYGRNEECYHVCCATNFTGTPSDTWIDAGAAALAEAQRRYPNAQIVGHKDIALKGHETVCPGPLWNTWKGVLLTRVQGLLRVAPDDLTVAWGPIATPRDDQWSWVSTQVWAAHRTRLGQCRSGLLYDNDAHVIMQCFERGITRQINDRAWEVCYL